MNKNLNYIIKISILIIIGIISMIISSQYINYFHTSMYLLIIIVIIYQIITSLRKNNFSYFNLIILIINILMLTTLIFFPNLYVKLLPTIVGIYIFLVGISKLLTVFLYDDIPKSRIYFLINALIHLVFSVTILIKPTLSLKSFTFVSGIYIIILGISYIPSKNKNNIKIIETPVIFQSLKPYLDFIKINLDDFNNQDNKIEVDIEVLIHIRRNQRGVFGHADIIYNNKIYSYGNYDANTYVLGDAFGEGVLIEAEKQSYIKYCKSYGKTLFSFGIKLNKEQKKQVEEYFQELMNNTYIFDKKKIKKDSYIDKLNKNANVTFYKFKNGHYQKYSFLNYNCTKFIEEFIDKKLLDFNSISTPGTLYTKLEESYQEKNNNVIRKTIY